MCIRDRHISWYTKNMPDSSAFRNEINHITTKEELLQRIENYFTNIKNEI